MNQPVFPYTRMRTRKVGGGNARKNSLGTPARFLELIMTQTHKPQECNQPMKRDGHNKV